MGNQIDRFTMFTKISLFLAVLFTISTVYSFFHPYGMDYNEAIIYSIRHFNAQLILALFFYLVTIICFMYSNILEFLLDIYNKKEDK